MTNEDSVRNSDSFYDDDVKKCKCGCGLFIMNQELDARLWVVERQVSFRFNFNSWCRCEEHNRKEGGSPTSSHLYGSAVDIATINSSQRFQLIKVLCFHGFNRIGIGSSFVHADIDPAKSSSVIWIY